MRLQREGVIEFYRLPIRDSPMGVAADKKVSPGGSMRLFNYLPKKTGRKIMAFAVTGILIGANGSVMTALADPATASNASYTVRYQFVSGSAGEGLPQEVLAKLPASTVQANNTSVSAPALTDTIVKVQNGSWILSKWEPQTAKIDGGDVTFVGTWIFNETSDRGSSGGGGGSISRGSRSSADPIHSTGSGSPSTPAPSTPAPSTPAPSAPAPAPAPVQQPAPAPVSAPAAASKGRFQVPKTEDKAPVLMYAALTGSSLLGAAWAFRKKKA